MKRKRVKLPCSSLEAWFAERHHTALELQTRCENTHPNHEYMGYAIEGVPQFWQSWCLKCARLDAWTGPANPEMSPEHKERAIAECQKWIAERHA